MGRGEHKTHVRHVGGVPVPKRLQTGDPLAVPEHIRHVRDKIRVHHGQSCDIRQIDAAVKQIGGAAQQINGRCAVEVDVGAVRPEAYGSAALADRGGFDLFIGDCRFISLIAAVLDAGKVRHSDARGGNGAFESTRVDARRRQLLDDDGDALGAHDGRVVLPLLHHGKLVFIGDLRRAGVDKGGVLCRAVFKHAVLVCLPDRLPVIEPLAVFVADLELLNLPVIAHRDQLRRDSDGASLAQVEVEGIPVVIIRFRKEVVKVRIRCDAAVIGEVDISIIFAVSVRVLVSPDPEMEGVVFSAGAGDGFADHQTRLRPYHVNGVVAVDAGEGVGIVVGDAVAVVVMGNVGVSGAVALIDADGAVRPGPHVIRSREISIAVFQLAAPHPQLLKTVAVLGVEGIHHGLTIRGGDDVGGFDNFAAIVESAVVVAQTRGRDVAAVVVSGIRV